MAEELKKALIIFARRPAPGRVKTRLSPPLSPEEAARFYGCMLLDTLAKVGHLTGMAKFLCHGPDPDAPAFFARTAPGMTIRPQRGNDLGERMAAAFGEIFAAGYGAAAIIGSDSPDLPLSRIEEAFRLLARPGVDVVFGPTMDGGYYLVAMKKLHPALFRDVPWSSCTVLETSMAHAAAAGIEAALLPPWHDIDLPEDLARPELRGTDNGAPLTREFIELRLAAPGVANPPGTKPSPVSAPIPSTKKP